MTKRNQIKKILAEQNNANAMRLQNLNRQKRLQRLVDDYGIEDVSLASGLSAASISQYLRTKTPIIGEQSITQAENIFKQLSK